MTERLLQYLWQFQYFNKSSIFTTDGEPLKIIDPGKYNTDQGPDFLNARINLSGTTWVGSIEIHIRSSDWDKHHHTQDPNYANVILHVVWQDDDKHPGHLMLPVLEIKNLVPKILLERYQKLMNSSAFIACESSIGSVKDITLNSWKERLIAERLMRKSKELEDLLVQNNYHWEQTFWIQLARNFGMRVNADAFGEMAKRLPLNLLARHKNEAFQLEALMMGQAGLLNHRYKDEYARVLKKEFRFLKKKYELHPATVPVFFLRMRPDNFPTIRLAQLAMLVHQSNHLFSRIRETESIEQIRKSFDITASEYWNCHYRFDEEALFRQKHTGRILVDNIIINSIAPMIFAYGHYLDEEKYKERALKWLGETGAEINSITKGFRSLGLEIKNARDSQALIQLKNEFCNRKACLDCSIGNALLRT